MKKTRLLIILLFAMLIFVGILSIPWRIPSKRLQKANDKIRITLLQQLYQVVKYYSYAYNEPPNNLFIAIDYYYKNKHELPYSISVYRKNNQSYFLEDLLKDKKEFEKYCDYMIISNKNRWGILELIPGKYISNYVFFIFQNGKIYKRTILGKNLKNLKLEEILGKNPKIGEFQKIDIK